MDLAAQVAARQRQLDAQVGQARALAQRGQELQRRAGALQVRHDATERAVAVLGTIADERDLTARHTIEALVSRGLQAIFGEDLQFRLLSETKRDQAHVEFVVVSMVDGKEVETSVLDARGGGLAAVVGLLLRVVIMLLGRTDKQGLLVLDETLAMLSQEYLPAAAEFLRELVDQTGIQVLMVTHQEELAETADKMYKFDLVDGVTKIREMR